MGNCGLCSNKRIVGIVWVHLFAFLVGIVGGLVCVAGVAADCFCTNGGWRLFAERLDAAGGLGVCYVRGDCFDFVYWFYSRWANTCWGSLKMGNGAPIRTVCFSGCLN